MLSRNNQSLTTARMNRTAFHYSLRKLNVGLVSVLLGVGVGIGLGNNDQVARAATPVSPTAQVVTAPAAPAPTMTTKEAQAPAAGQTQPGTQPAQPTGQREQSSAPTQEPTIGHQAVTKEQGSATSAGHSANPAPAMARDLIPAPDPVTPTTPQQKDSYAPAYTVDLPEDYPAQFLQTIKTNTGTMNLKDYYVFKGILDQANGYYLWTAVKRDGSELGTLYVFWQPAQSDYLTGWWSLPANSGRNSGGDGIYSITIYNYGTTYTVVDGGANSLYYEYSSDGEKNNVTPDGQSMITGVLPTKGNFQIKVNYTDQNGQVTTKTIEVPVMAGMSVKVAAGAVVEGYVKTDAQTGVQDKIVSEYTHDKVGQTWTRHFAPTPAGDQYTADYTLNADGTFTLKLYNHDQLLTNEAHQLDGDDQVLTAGKDGSITVPLDRYVILPSGDGSYRFPNPFEPGSANVTYDYHQVGRIIPVGRDGKTPLPGLTAAQQPSYPNDPQDPTKVLPTRTPTIPGYTIKPGQSVVGKDGQVTPADPTKDTDVIYLRDQSVQVVFVDQGNGSQSVELSRDPVITGPEGTEAVDPAYQASLQYYLDQGYRLIHTGYGDPIQFPPASVVTSATSPYLVEVFLQKPAPAPVPEQPQTPQEQPGQPGRTPANASLETGAPTTVPGQLTATKAPRVAQSRQPGAAQLPRTGNEPQSLLAACGLAMLGLVGLLAGQPHRKH